MASGAVRDRILRSGQRITPQRDLIAEVLERAGRPLTAQELWTTVSEKEPSIGRATVFRTLQSLQEAGIVEHLTLAANQVGYLLCGSPEHHHHLVCQRCGRVEDLGEQDVKPFLAKVERMHRFTADHSSFSIYGTCAACQE
jgi:Fur family ferric uptake transcriptional regulator